MTDCNQQAIENMGMRNILVYKIPEKVIPYSNNMNSGQNESI